MPRTTPELVAALNNEYDDTISLDAPIEMANALVTELCEPVKKSDGTFWHDATRLELIERNLAMHFYCVDDPRVSHEQLTTLVTRFEGHSGLGLDFTRYGQQAKLLDTSGALAKWDADMKDGKLRKRFKVHWLGTVLE